MRDTLYYYMLLYNYYHYFIEERERGERERRKRHRTPPRSEDNRPRIGQLRAAQALQRALLARARARARYTYILEPHNGENDVGERSDLLDVSHLANRQIDLHPCARFHSRAHYRLHVDVELMLLRIRRRYARHSFPQRRVG